MHGKRSKFMQGFQIFYDQEETTEVDGNIVVSKRETYRYSFSSSLYRDITSFCLSIGTTEYFSFQKIAEWVLEVNQYYKNYYTDSKARTNRANRIKAITKTIKEYIFDLVDLEILTTRPTKAHNRETTNEYKFTYFAKLVALLLELDKPKERRLISIKDISREIYNVLKTRFEVSKSSIDLFCLIMYEKLVEKDLFKVVVDHYKNVLKNPLVKSRLEFFQYLNLIQSESESAIIWKIYDESLYELKKLDYKKYQIFLFNLKQLLENLQLIKCRTFFIFEKWRYDNREIDTIVVIEGCCDNCKQYTSGPAYLKDYLQNYFSGNKISEVCPNCGIGKLDFETLIEDE